MLDELDALMERMLSLPVAELDTSPPAPPPLFGLETAPLELAEEAPPGAREATTAPVQIPSTHLAADHAISDMSSPPPSPLQGPHIWPVPSGKIMVGRLSAPPLYSLPAKETVDSKMQQANVPANEQPVDVMAIEPLPPEIDLPPLIVKPASQLTGREPGRGNSVLRAGFQPLLRLNRAFDHATAWLGEMGKGLRSAGGRNLLGIAGLVLLALAVVWCLHDWLGWNWFKLSLE
jgi:hypothetical protein